MLDIMGIPRNKAYNSEHEHVEDVLNGMTKQEECVAHT